MAPGISPGVPIHIIVWQLRFGSVVFSAFNFVADLRPLDFDDSEHSGGFGFAVHMLLRSI